MDVLFRVDLLILAEIERDFRLATIVTFQIPHKCDELALLPDAKFLFGFDLFNAEIG